MLNNVFAFLSFATAGILVWFQAKPSKTFSERTCFWAYILLVATIIISDVDSLLRSMLDPASLIRFGHYHWYRWLFDLNSFTCGFTSPFRTLLLYVRLFTYNIPPPLAPKKDLTIFQIPLYSSAPS